MIALIYYFATTMIAVIIGILLVITIQVNVISHFCSSPARLSRFDVLQQLLIYIQPGKWTAAVPTDDILDSGSGRQAPCISTAMDTILDLVRFVRV